MSSSDKKIKGYICGTDWDYDLRLGANDVKIYTSVKVLKQERQCIKECGIVEIEIVSKRIIQKSNFRDR